MVEEFIDVWIMHAFLLPTNVERESYKTETINQLVELVDMLSDLEIARFALTERSEVTTGFSEEKKAD